MDGLKAIEEERKAHLSTQSDLVIGLVGPLGTDWDIVCAKLVEHFQAYGYAGRTVHISADLIPNISGQSIEEDPKYEHYCRRIDLGNAIRRKCENNGLLGIACVAHISQLRKESSKEPTAYIVRSLKHPEEVAELRTTYAAGFYLFGVHTARSRQIDRLMGGRGMQQEEAEQLVELDANEDASHGQHARDTFQLADFFLSEDGNSDKLEGAISRSLDLIFGLPHVTPTFGEYAMFMAFASSLRSGDLSRQTGAVIASEETSEIISAGANDAPRAGGGLYWPEYSEGKGRIADHPEGRDSVRGQDSNAAEKERIVQMIAEKLEDHVKRGHANSVASALRDGPLAKITEYGRPVHAEMEALMSCARQNVSCRGSTLYATTFPCHNCAKHIISAGVLRVVYIEPYPKSMALVLHDDAITENPEETSKIVFEPFIGVGPRRFFDLFSTSLGSGRRLQRKESDGTAVTSQRMGACPRLIMTATTYVDLERSAMNYAGQAKEVMVGELVD